LKRFIANSARKKKAFSPLLKVKDKDQFTYEEEQKLAFDQIKQVLDAPSVLVPVPPILGKALKLYIFTVKQSIRCLLTQDAED